jgi:thiol-disulfide isomerase/thioredoxin
MMTRMQERTGRQPHLLERPAVRLSIAILVVGAAVAGVLLAREGSGDSGAAGSGTPASVAYVAPVYTLCEEGARGEGVLEGGRAAVGEPAPDFALCDDDGDFVTTLSQMQGKVVWLNFWATWCVPCKRELPDIQKLYDELRESGLEVLIINYRESREKAVAFLPGLGVEMPVVIDRPGAIYDQYRLTGLPDSFFIGRDGRIATLYYGFVTEEIARERLRTAGIE